MGTLLLFEVNGTDEIKVRFRMSHCKWRLVSSLDLGFLLCLHLKGVPSILDSNQFGHFVHTDMVTLTTQQKLPRMKPTASCLPVLMRE